MSRLIMDAHDCMVEIVPHRDAVYGSVVECSCGKLWRKSHDDRWIRLGPFARWRLYRKLERA